MTDNAALQAAAVMAAASASGGKYSDKTRPDFDSSRTKMFSSPVEERKSHSEHNGDIAQRWVSDV